MSWFTPDDHPVPLLTRIVTLHIILIWTLEGIWRIHTTCQWFTCRLVVEKIVDGGEIDLQGGICGALVGVITSVLDDLGFKDLKYIVCLIMPHADS